MIERAIITGATCSLGIALTQYLLEQGGTVTAIVRPHSSRISALPRHPRLQVVACELSQLATLENLPSHDGGTFFHLGWNTTSVSMTGDPAAQAESIVMTLAAVKLAAALKCTGFVGAGSQAEYGRCTQPLTPDTPTAPETSYGIAKYAAGQLSRQLCERLGLRHCWCRILSLYGPFDKPTTGLMYCLTTLLRGEKPSLTPCEQVWDYIYVADCARALCLAAEYGRPGVVYPIGSGHPRPLREYFTAIRDRIDPQLSLGFGEKAYSPRQIMQLSTDLSRLTADTGFVPVYSFAAGMEKMIAWLNSQEHVQK